MRVSLTASSLLLAILVAPASGQTTVDSISLGWAVDTTISPVREIVQTVVAYYRLPQPGRTPTPLWVQDEQHRFSLYDLAGPTIYQHGFNAIIVGVSPSLPDSSLYVVQTLFARLDADGVQPLGLQRLYAHPAVPPTFAPFGWQLSGALPLLTADWPIRRVGRIRYHLTPGYPFLPRRAATADKFLTTASRRIGVLPPDQVEYYLTPSWEAVNRLTGLDWGLTGAAFAGRAFPQDRLVLAGNPALGEAFTHELAHLVLAAFGSADSRHRLIEEGAATWLGGGNLGPDVNAYFQLLVAYQRAHPTVTFHDLLTTFDAEAAFYATGALITQAAISRGGVSQLVHLLRIAPTNDALLATLPGLIGVPADSLDLWWRDAASAAAQ